MQTSQKIVVILLFESFENIIFNSNFQKKKSKLLNFAVLKFKNFLKFKKKSTRQPNIQTLQNFKLFKRIFNLLELLSCRKLIKF